MKKKTTQGLAILVLLFTMHSNAQEKGLDLDEIRVLAFDNNAGLKAAELKVRASKALVGSAFDFEKTDIYYHYDQNNLAFNNEPLEVYGIQQNFMFPTVYFAGKRVNKANLGMEESTYEMQKQMLERDVASAYFKLLYTREKRQVLAYLDSIYQKFAVASQRRFELGESNYLEKITAQAKQKELQTLFNQAREDVAIAEIQLQKTTQVDQSLNVAERPLWKLKLQSQDVSENIGLALYDKRSAWYSAKSALEKQYLLPDISLNYFQGTNPGLGEQLYGYQVGLKIPLLFSGNASKIKAANITKDMAIEESLDYKNLLYMKYEELMGQLRKYEEALSYYEGDGQRLADEILKTASISYQHGEIDFFQYIQSLENAYRITLSYLENINNYNQTVIELNHLTL